MEPQNEVELAQNEEWPGGLLGELACDIAGELLTETLIGYIVLILAVVVLLVIGSTMNE